MSLYICSLIRDGAVDGNQSIPADGEYHTIRFPFGSRESYDVHEMHQVAQPDSYTITSWDTDERSGLIWPAVAGWATITGMIYWSSGSYSELCDRVIRDPLGLSSNSENHANTTATEHRPPTAGLNPFHKTHQLFVEPGVPVATQVKTNVASSIYHAQFKLAIETNVAEGV
jgi:cell wall assembly regulator SMI1